jgi:hypothetical protein
MSAPNENDPTVGSADNDEDKKNNIFMIVTSN